MSNNGHYKRPARYLVHQQSLDNLNHLTESSVAFIARYIGRNVVINPCPICEHTTTSILLGSDVEECSLTPEEDDHNNVKFYGICRCSLCTEVVFGIIRKYRWDEGGWGNTDLLRQDGRIDTMSLHEMILEPLYSAKQSIRALGKIGGSILNWEDTCYIPPAINNDLSEAFSCFSVGAYRSTSVNCRRILELICISSLEIEEVPSGKLVEYMQKLKKKDILDETLFEWAKKINIISRYGAHEKGLNMTAYHANSLLNLVESIIEHIYIMPAKNRKIHELASKDLSGFDSKNQLSLSQQNNGKSEANEC